MQIELSKEMESLIRKDVERGLYATPEELVTEAVHLLLEQEEWFESNRDLIATAIDEGWDEAERGEVLTADEARAELARFKRQWREEQQQAA